MRRNQTLSFGEVHRFVDTLFGDNLHAKRVLSLANATLGVINTASLAVNTIGHGLAMARGLTSKHAIKQVDRLLSNPAIDVAAADGQARAAADWVAPGGRTRLLRDALITEDRYQVGSMLCVQEKAMKQPCISPPAARPRPPAR